MPKPITNQIRQQIKMYIKNGLDISSLIKDVEIRGEDLRRAKIKDFDRPNTTISNTNFSDAIIGEQGKITDLCDCKFINCEFVNTKFYGTVFLRRCKCIDCNFNCAWLVDVEYQYTEFINTTFCEAVIRIGTDYGYKAKFDENLFRDLSKQWRVEVRLKEESNG